MMSNDMPKGSSVPVWGEGSVSKTYVAPGKAWDGTPYHVDPGSKAVDGYNPRDRPPAQELNYHLNEIGQWLKYLARFSVSNFTDHVTVASGVITEVLDVGFNPVFGQWYMTGTDGSGTPAEIAYSHDLITWSAATIISAGSREPDHIFCDPETGIVHAFLDGIDYTKTTATGNFTSAGTVNSGNTVPDCIVVADQRLICHSDLGIYYSDNDGADWTLAEERDNEPATRLGYNPDNDTIVLKSDSKSWYSTDNGETWGSVAREGDGLAFSKTEGLFMTCDIVTGSFFTSPDGITWTERTSNAASTIDISALLAPESLVSVGGAWFIIAPGVGPAGVEVGLVSFDNGDNWNIVPIGPDKSIARVSAGNGQILLAGTPSGNGGQFATSMAMAPIDWNG